VHQPRPDHPRPAARDEVLRVEVPLTATELAADYTADEIAEFRWIAAQWPDAPQYGPL
jgi:hypothetical protein